MRKCGLFGLLFVALFINSFAFSLDANAQTPSLTPVDSLQLSIRKNSPSDPFYCEPKDYSNDISSYLLDENKWNGQDLTDARTSFNKALTYGHWAIIQEYDHDEDTDFIVMYWVEEEDAQHPNLGNDYYNWSPGHVDLNFANDKGRMITFTLGKNVQGSWGNCDPIVLEYQDTTSGGIFSELGSGDVFRRYFLSTFPPNYPQDYDGEPIKDSHGVKESFYGDVSISVQDKLVEVTFNNDTLPFEYGACSVHYLLNSSPNSSRDYGDSVGETLKLGWQQILAGDITLKDWRDQNRSMNMTKEEFFPDKSPNSTIRYHADDYGSVWITYIVNTDWIGIPAPHCGDSVLGEDFPYKAEYRTVVVNIDGSEYLATTVGADCRSGGSFCTSQDVKDAQNAQLYEECDLIDIPCHFRNARTFFIGMFTHLFVPDFSVLKPHFQSFKDVANEHLGFFADAISIIFSAFNMLITTGNPNTGYTCPIPLSFFGSSANVELCAWRYQMPEMWSLMQKSIQAGISVTLIYVFYRKWRELFGDHVEDGTEIESNPYPGETVSWVNERTGERGKIK